MRNRVLTMSIKILTGALRDDFALVLDAEVFSSHKAIPESALIDTGMTNFRDDAYIALSTKTMEELDLSNTGEISVVGIDGQETRKKVLTNIRLINNGNIVYTFNNIPAVVVDISDDEILLSTNFLMDYMKCIRLIIDMENKTMRIICP